MSVEEDREALKDLVAQTLESKGVLGKIQAEIRASVFLALEEQDVFKDKSPYINEPLKQFVSTQEGELAVSLVREFLEFFKLDFTSMVFDPETHSGLYYNYEGRHKLIDRLNLQGNDSKVPLLSQILASMKLNKSYVNGNDTFEVSSGQAYTNGIDHGEDKKKTKTNSNHVAETEEPIVSRVIPVKSPSPTKPDPVKTNSYLPTIGGFPPLNTPIITKREEIVKTITDDIDKIMSLDSGDNNYDEDFSAHTSVSEKVKKAPGSGSETSEIEEEISNHSASAVEDENTADITISKASANADFSEDI